MSRRAPTHIRARVFAGDPWHSAEIVRQGLAPLGAAGFDFDFAETASASPAADLQSLDLVILAKANLIASQQLQPWLKTDADHGLAQFVARGGGLLVIHAGTSRYDHLPALTTLIGGAFVRHPEPCAVTLAPLRKNALTREVSAFTERDEHYFVNLSAPDAGVFLRSTSAHGAQPAGWTRTPGAGRVCVLTPGHNQAVWRHPSFQKLLLNSARWAAKLN